MLKGLAKEDLLKGKTIGIDATTLEAIAALRSIVHCYDTGGMRRTHLRGHENILKRLLIHNAGFNLGLIMRKLYSVGKPRRLQGVIRVPGAFFALFFGWIRVWESYEKEHPVPPPRDGVMSAT